MTAGARGSDPLNLKEIAAVIEDPCVEAAPMRATAAELLAALREARTALKPFAHFAAMWDAKPLNAMADAFYGIHSGSEFAAELTLTDVRRARTVLGGGHVIVGARRPLAPDANLDPGAFGGPVSGTAPPEPSEKAIDAAEKVARAPEHLRSWREEMRLRLRAAYAVDRGAPPPEPPLERFERIAAEFYEDTGYLRPGKDVPAALGGEAYDYERNAAWKIWNAARLRGEAGARPRGYLGGCNCSGKAPTIPTCRGRNTHLDDCPAKDSGWPVGAIGYIDGEAGASPEGPWIAIGGFVEKWVPNLGGRLERQIGPFSDVEAESIRDTLNRVAAASGNAVGAGGIGEAGAPPLSIGKIIAWLPCCSGPITEGGSRLHYEACRGAGAPQ